MAISTFPAAAGGAAKIRKAENFTASGTFTAPAGVTHVMVGMVAGGGGGGGDENNGSSGGSTSFDGNSYAGARGGVGANGATQEAGSSAAANTGGGGSAYTLFETGEGSSTTGDGADSNLQWRGFDVIAGNSYTVTIGAGGSGRAPGGNGGSGYLVVTYEVEA